MAKDEPQAIRFSAQPSKFTTLVDGTKRIYLDLVRTDKETNAEILETVGVPGVLWEVAAVAVKAEAPPIEPKKTNDKPSRANPLYAPKAHG